MSKRRRATYSFITSYVGSFPERIKTFQTLLALLDRFAAAS